MYNTDSLLTEDDLSLLSSEEHSQLINTNNEMFCPECWCIPKIKIDSQKHIIISDCDFNHHCNLDLKQFIKMSSNHSLFDVSCSFCQKNQNKSKIIFQYCSECKFFLCNICTANHDKIKTNISHHLISIDKFNSHCIFHKNKFNIYCETCSKNICNKCKINHEKHKIIHYENVYPSKEEIYKISTILNKQREEFNKLEIFFKDLIQKIINKFHKYLDNELITINRI